MQYAYDKLAVVKRYETVLGEYNRPQKTLVTVGTYESFLAQSTSNTNQLVAQKKNTTDLVLYTSPEANIKLGDIIYVYDKNEYEEPILSSEYKAIADRPYKKRTQLRVPLLSEEEV